MKRVLDTNAVLYLLGDRLAAPLEIGEYFVSVISEMELLSYPGLTAQDDRQLRTFLGGIRVLELTGDIKNRAIDLRRRHGLKLPDAIVAASAQSLDAELVTNDLQLLRVPGIKGQSLQLK